MAETMYSPDTKIFWTYDETQAIALKAQYVDAYNMRGIMFWEISGDDSNGTLVKTLHSRNMPDVDYDESRIANKSPKISIIQPENKAQFSAGSNLVISTNVKDENGSVVKVEFFVDGKSIGFDTKAPFSWAWFNVSQGKYELKCTATDNIGTSTQSAKIEINIYSNNTIILD